MRNTSQCSPPGSAGRFPQCDAPKGLRPPQEPVRSVLPSGQIKVNLHRTCLQTAPFWESLPSSPLQTHIGSLALCCLGRLLGMARRSAWLWHWPRIWPFVLSRRSELANGIARARHWLLAGTGLAIGWRSVRPRHGPRMAHGHGARPFKILQDTHRSHRACCLGRLLAPSQPLC